MVKEEVIFMKILVDEMPVFPDDDCWFSDQVWDDEENVWKTYCTLGLDGVTDCDLIENGECSKLIRFS